MVQITRGKGPSGRSQLGQVRSASSVSTAGREVGAVTEKLGGVVGAIGSEYMQKAQGALSTAIYDNAMGSATKELNAQYQERAANRLDKDGNPNFGNLAADTQAIGESVLKSKSTRLLDPVARQQFTRDFNTTINNSVARASASSRSQELDYTIAQANKGIRDFVGNLPAVDITSLPGELARLDKIQRSYLANGTISYAQYEKTKADTSAAAYKFKITEMIDKNPELLRDALDRNDPSVIGMDSFGVSALERISLSDVADAAIHDRAVYDAKVSKTRAKKTTEDQNNAYTLADQRLAADDLGQAEIATMGNDGTVNPFQEQKLSQKLYYKEKKDAAKLEVDSIITDSIATGVPLVGVTTKMLDDNFKSRLPANPTPQQAGGLAAEYPAALPSITGPLSYMGQSEDLSKIAPYLEQYDYLSKKNPAALVGISKKSALVFSTALDLKEHNPDLPMEEVIKRSQHAVLDVDNDVYAERESTLNNDENFTDEDHIKGTANRIFSRGWFSDNLAPGVTNALTKSLRRNYIATGSKDSAMSATKAEFAVAYGPTRLLMGDPDSFLGVSVNSNNSISLFEQPTIMAYAPEHIYKNTDFAIIQQDYEQVKSEGVLPEGVGKEKIYFKYDTGTTSKDGELSYAMEYVDNDGLPQPLRNASGDIIRWATSRKGFDDITKSNSDTANEKLKVQQAADRIKAGDTAELMGLRYQAEANTPRGFHTGQPDIN
jgi:hypothetical protein